MPGIGAGIDGFIDGNIGGVEKMLDVAEMGVEIELMTEEGVG